MSQNTSTATTIDNSTNIENNAYESVHRPSPHKGLSFYEKDLYAHDPSSKDGVINKTIQKRITTQILRLGSKGMRKNLKLPNNPENMVVRHYTRLSQKNYGIDVGIHPLGSCTMKYNPRINERIARLDGFAHTHPLQNPALSQGNLRVIHELSEWLCHLTGMEDICFSPAAGAHGEYAGMLTIKQALLAHNQENRDHVLIPDSAHGTNPATADRLGFKIIRIATGDDGLIDMDDFEHKLLAHKDVIGAIMITNPNTCGLFEVHLAEISQKMHDIDAYVYCDGANFNAICGLVKPGDLGVDAMHINLHKTFSTPHGGGGPGSGPVVLSHRIKDHAPTPRLQKNADGTFDFMNATANENKKHNKGKNPTSPLRIKAFHGQFGMFTRALAFMKRHGLRGLRDMSLDAIMHANYLAHRLSPHYDQPFKGRVMHEVLLSDKNTAPHKITTQNIAKTMMDFGVHPMTVYFPLVVKGAMLIEPTETETQETLDELADILIYLADKANKGDIAFFMDRPHHTPVKQVDEVKAAKQLVLSIFDE